MLDDVETAARMLDFDDGERARVTFSVPSMHCASCLWLLEQLWRFDPGITHSEADLMRRTIRVTYRTDRTSLRRVAEQLAALGYEPRLESERSSGITSPAVRRLYLQIGIARFAFGNIMLFSIPRARRRVTGSAPDLQVRRFAGATRIRTSNRSPLLGPSLLLP